MKIVFHIAALKEFRDERPYYNAKAQGLGDRLIALVDETLMEIASAPHSDQRIPVPTERPRARLAGSVDAIPVLGGLHHHYCAAA